MVGSKYIYVSILFLGFIAVFADGKVAVKVIDGVQAFQGDLQERKTYRIFWPLLGLRAEHGTAYHIDWNKGSEVVDIADGDLVVFRVNSIERNKITAERLNLTYVCEILLHLALFDETKTPELKKKIVAAATPEALVRKFDLTLYDVRVSEDTTIVDGRIHPEYIVSFIDKKAQPRGIGNRGSIPALEVHIDRETLRVTKAHFVR